MQQDQPLQEQNEKMMMMPRLITLQTLTLRGMLMTSQQLRGEDVATSKDVVLYEVTVEVDVIEITLVNVAEV